MPQTPPSRPTGMVATLALVALVVAIATGGLWWVRHQDGSSATDADPDTDPGSHADRSLDALGGRDNGAGGRGAGRGDGSDADPDLGEQAEEIATRDFPDDPRVVVISADGLGSLWVSRSSTPALAELMRQGAGTLDARTAFERTVTLPNHTGMVTGVRVNAAHGGHGVTWNHTSARSVAPGTDSIFSTIDDAGGSSAVFAGKEKFEMWGRAWPGTIDELEIDGDQTALVTEAITDLHEDDHDLVFLHLGGPDAAGHDHGWGSDVFLDAVAQADGDLDRVVSAIAADPELAEEVVVIVTADHGGVPGTTTHTDRDRPENYTIPFVVWGPGIGAGDLYALNPDYLDPGTGRPGYGGPQPVRNGDIANLVTDLLGLGPVPGSQFDADHELDVE